MCVLVSLPSGAWADLAILDAKNRVSASVTEQQQASLKISHLEKSLQEEEPKAKKAKEQNSGLLNGLEGLRLRTKELESELSRSGFDEDLEARMSQERSTLQERIRELRDRSDSLRRKVASIDFTYQDPVPTFDRLKVKGLLAQLFTLDVNKSKAGTALEICAGGRLYNVVVDTEVTGTQLLQGGRLRKRVTIIPLNKIAAFRASAEVRVRRWQVHLFPRIIELTVNWYFRKLVQLRRSLPAKSILR